MPSLTVILGAGFSFMAGLPLAHDIKKRFDRDLRGKLLQFGSSEWQWVDEKSETDIHNGQLSLDRLSYSYILNELVKKYKLSKGGFDNYELFYQWIQDISHDTIIKNQVYLLAKKALIADYPHLNEFVPKYEGDVSPYLIRFENDSDLSNLSGIINYLIADLLGFTKNQFDNAISEYEQFANCLKQFDQVDIFTLNHDLFLERILDYFGIEFSRGFNKENSEIQYQDKGTPIAVFKDTFPKSVRIHKLHGSLDFYRFEHYVQGGKIYLEPTGEYNYFTTNDYREKHFAIRVDPNTGEALQDHNFDIIPKFITSTDKAKIIKNDLMYAKLFERFEKSMAIAEKVLISGYSFGDEHINQELKKRSDFNIVNQNPNNIYPFSSKEVINIISLKELN